MVPVTITRLLNRLRWRDRWLSLARGLAFDVGFGVDGVVFVWLVDWYVDRWTDTPLVVCAALLLVQLVAWLAGLYCILPPLLRRYRDDDLARWIERELPMGQRLIAAVQLNRKSADVRGM